ncbi:hypothetical protein ACFV1B_11835 [Streptomyces sp. NPDC059637]|uniref:hypothetical protein n=1 Tax=Streptomyces TaxID=1883 RepID=UPI0031D87546
MRSDQVDAQHPSGSVLLLPNAELAVRSAVQARRAARAVSFREPWRRDAVAFARVEFRGAVRAFVDLLRREVPRLLEPEAPAPG